MRRRCALFLAIGSLATFVTAQPATPAWGTAAESLLSIPALAFETFNNTVSHTITPGGSRYITAGPSTWFAPIALPSGTLVTGLELQGCDESDTSQLTVSMFRLSTTGGMEQATVVGTILATTLAAIPNCDQFSLAFPAPVVIDNADAMYVVRVLQVGDVTGLVRFAGVRVRYRLQVSPAPGAATFTDVPTGHPFFRFVEALVGAGITAGCGGGNYCVDTPISRGEMAVFLSVALGLHFPN